MHIDIELGRADAKVAVAEMLHAFPDRARIVVLAGTDEAALGAVDAIKQARPSAFSLEA